MAFVEQGLSSAEIGRRLGVDPRTVRRWKRERRLRGEAGLDVKKAPGAKSQLDGRQRHGLKRRLIAGAAAQGFATDVWTSRRIAELIEREYGVTYHVDHIPYLMKSLGFSAQKPELRAKERDEEAIRQWVDRDWPRIKKKRLASARG
jgi:transposase